MIDTRHRCSNLPLILLFLVMMIFSYGPPHPTSGQCQNKKYFYELPNKKAASILHQFITINYAELTSKFFLDGSLLLI